MEESDNIIIEKRSLAEQVYMYLCNSISNGKLKYGDTINTKRLAEELHISMMPVREALKRLEMDGVVEIKPRSMCLLRTPTKEAIMDAIAAREMLEIYSVRSMYASIDVARLDVLREIIDKMKAAIAEDPINLRKYIKYDWQFHKELCNLSGNQFISKFYKELNIRLNMDYMYDIGIKPNVSQTFKDHIDLVEALAAHSPTAVEIIEKHLRISRQNILNGRFFSVQDAAG
ncbi:MAG: GntR family transcriptional regulator [Rectinema sp.]